MTIVQWLTDAYLTENIEEKDLMEAYSFTQLSHFWEIC